MNLKKKFGNMYIMSNDRGASWHIEPKTTSKHLILKSKNQTFESYDRGASWTLLSVPSEFDVKIYPNPATDFVQIDFKKKHAFDKINISITDIQGRTVYNLLGYHSSYKIDTQHYIPGFYILSIIGENLNYNQSLIINRQFIYGCYYVV